jgi:hypothetical protein
MILGYYNFHDSGISQSPTYKLLTGACITYVVSWLHSPHVRSADARKMYVAAAVF